MNVSTFTDEGGPFKFPDRRRHPRLSIARPCKVASHGACRFAFARTRDVSRGGLMVEMDLERPLAAGDRVDVAVAWGDEAVVSSSSLVEAKVVRVHPTGEKRATVALEFLKKALAQAA